MDISKKFLFNALILFGLAIILCSSCDLDNSSEIESEPDISTLEIKDITATTVFTGGNITADEGTIVTARGVCWSTGQNPTIEHSKTKDGIGPGSFTSSVSALDPNTTYYIRAYATYSGGTVYGSAHSFTTSSFGTVIVDVTNPITGRIWMDRNLGANRVAQSSTDEEAYGDLYQWGRGSDGHEKRDSPTTATSSSSDSPGHGSFIQSNHPYDWRSPQNPNLWQGVNGVNNPCPPGYRLPTAAEMNAELASWNSKNANGAFASPLKLTKTGVRNPNGSLAGVGRDGDYWSSSVNYTTASQALFFNDEFANNASPGEGGGVRGFGFAVRCIKD